MRRFCALIALSLLFVAAGGAAGQPRKAPPPTKWLYYLKVTFVGTRDSASLYDGKQVVEYHATTSWTAETDRPFTISRTKSGRFSFRAELEGRLRHVGSGSGITGWASEFPCAYTSIDKAGEATVAGSVGLYPTGTVYPRIWIDVEPTKGAGETGLTLLTPVHEDSAHSCVSSVVNGVTFISEAPTLTRAVNLSKVIGRPFILFHPPRPGATQTHPNTVTASGPTAGSYEKWTLQWVLQFDPVKSKP